MKILPEEFRLAYQAKSGDTAAFIKLYDICVERVYCYIYFLVPNASAAEAFTFQVFFRAWEQLDHYQIFGSSFIVWLCSVARSHVIAYFRTYKKTFTPDTEFTLAVRGEKFIGEFQVIRDSLRLLTLEQQQVLILKFMVGMSNRKIGHIISRSAGDVRVLQMYGLQVLAAHLQKTEIRIDAKGFYRIFEGCLARFSKDISTLSECLVRYPEHASQLIPLLETVLLLNIGNSASPLSAFKEYTHDALAKYVQSHPRQRQVVMPIFQRAALTFAMLAAVFLVTGTVQAQSALPGEPLYVLKRASEQAWRAVSPDPVATDIILAERRLNEWVAVASDPILNVSAKVDYLKVVTRLKSTNDEKSLALVVPVLQLQQQILSDAGLSTSELDDYLIDVLIQIAPTAIESTVTEIPTQAAPPETEAPAEIVPVETEVSTQVAPPETESPAEPVPTETEVPAEIVPTETEVPAEPVPTEIESPTEIVPMETEVPNEVVPTIAPTFNSEASQTEDTP